MSQQKSLCVPEALFFSCSDLEVSDALFFHLMALCSEGNHVKFYHPFMESDCCSSQGWGLKQEALPLPVPSGTCFFIPQPHRLVFLSLLEQCVQRIVFAVYFLSFISPCISHPALRPTCTVLRLL